jgi:hypothetical protein
MENKIGIALIHELCPVCAKENNSSIIINSRLTEKMANYVKEQNGKTVWSKEICPECKAMLNQGFVLIGAVQSKSEPNNPYRSGNLWCIKRETAQKIFGEELPEHGFAFIDVHDALEIGLPDVNINA